MQFESAGVANKSRKKIKSYVWLLDLFLNVFIGSLNIWLYTLFMDNYGLSEYFLQDLFLISLKRVIIIQRYKSSELYH